MKQLLLCLLLFDRVDQDEDQQLGTAAADCALSPWGSRSAHAMFKPWKISSWVASKLISFSHAELFELRTWGFFTHSLKL
jgi:hypothetical protein